MIGQKAGWAKKANNQNVVLDKKWQNKLSNMPETGMGFQVVDIDLKTGSTLKNVTILNGSIVKNVTFNQNDISNINLAK